MMLTNNPTVERIRSTWLTLPKWARLSAIGATVVAAAALAVVLRGDPVERAVARGDLHAARTELRQRQVADAGARSYDAGLISEAQGSFRAATASYVAAMRQGDDRGLERLIEMTRAPSCPTRSAAASALAKVRDPRSVRALKELGRTTFADERKKGRRSSCDSRRAAREALKRARKA
jgi:HEAT repeat protein